MNPTELNNNVTYIDQAGVVSVLDVVQHGRLVQTGELGHVLDLVEFGRVHLLDVVLEHEDALTGFGQFHLDLIAAFAFDAGRYEALEKVKQQKQDVTICVLRLRRRSAMSIYVDLWT